MKLTGGEPFWAVRAGLVAVAPPLREDLACDVVIIGSGITGALIADSLTSIGLNVVVVDRRDLASGSTTASTALLQYDIDVPLVELSKLIGLEQAQRAYRLGADALDTIQRASEAAGFPVHRRPSLYFSTSDESLEFLRRECEARREAGFDVKLVDEARLLRDWGIVARGAILSQQAAEVDPYSLAHALLAAAVRRGARVFDRTAVRNIQHDTGGVVIETDRGHSVKANWAVLATGYESQSCLPEKIVDLHSTYAIITEPCCEEAPWPDRALLWQHAQTYLYARTTPDNRIIVGGEDEDFTNEELRDALIPAKADALLAKLRKLIPGYAYETAFAWAGTFGGTKDGLGYIGPQKEGDRLLCALGFGGNGITFSVIAARMLARTIQGDPDPDQHLFRFGR